MRSASQGLVGCVVFLVPIVTGCGSGSNPGEGFVEATVDGVKLRQSSFSEGYHTQNVGTQIYATTAEANIVGHQDLWKVIVDGTTTGTYDANHVMVYYYKSPTDFYHQVQGFTGGDLSVTIARCDGVGGLIEGTFSGTMSYNDTGLVDVTDGAFSVPRTQDR